MLATRYEDHSDLKGKIPFSLVRDICRTKESCGSETNWHENLEIQICTEGEGFVLLDGDRSVFSAGDAVIVNANVIHYTATDTAMKYLCLIIDADFCRNADIDHDRLCFVPKVRSAALNEAVYALAEEYARFDDPCRTAKLQALLLRILILLREQFTVGEKKTAPERTSLGTVKQTIRYIRENYEKKILLSDIAKAVVSDKYTLAHIFKKATNQTIVEYTNIYRCKKAAEAIAGGATISEAARACGFQNMSFFTKTFRKHIGTLPSAYKPGKNG